MESRCPILHTFEDDEDQAEVSQSEKRFLPTDGQDVGDR
jgi:hypothetical protein